MPSTHQDLAPATGSWQQDPEIPLMVQERVLAPHTCTAGTTRTAGPEISTSDVCEAAKNWSHLPK